MKKRTDLVMQRKTLKIEGGRNLYSYTFEVNEGKADAKSDRVRNKSQRSQTSTSKR